MPSQELVGLPEGGPTTLALVKAHLKIPTEDTRDDASITVKVDAVNSQVRTWPVSYAAVDEDAWPASIVEGATMLAARYFRRKNSPAGVEAMGPEGATYVMRSDPDIAQLLGLGPGPVRAWGDLVDDLTPEPIDDLITALQAVDVQASMDPSDLNLPAAWVALDEIVPTNLAGGLELRCAVYLVGGDRDAHRWLTDLAPLYNAVLSVLTPDGPTQTIGVVMPGNPAPMPALKVPVFLHTTGA